MIYIIMGVSGCGKTAVGKALAKKLNIPFYDGDDFHPEANKTKMTRGIPLTDEDRKPWLEALSAFLLKHDSLVLACSALKASYRKALSVSPKVRFIYLKGSEALIRSRLEKRKGHFFDPQLLHSQFEALEEPEDALTVDITPPLDEVISNIMDAIS